MKAWGRKIVKEGVIDQYRNPYGGEQVRKRLAFYFTSILVPI